MARRHEALLVGMAQPEVVVAARVKKLQNYTCGRPPTLVKQLRRSGLMPPFGGGIPEVIQFFDQVLHIRGVSQAISRFVAAALCFVHRLVIRVTSVIVHPLPQFFCFFENLLDSQRQVFAWCNLRDINGFSRRIVIVFVRSISFWVE